MQRYIKKKKKNSCHRESYILVGGDKKSNKEVKSLVSSVDAGGEGVRKHSRKAGMGSGRSVFLLIGRPRKSSLRRSDRSGD